MADKEYAVMFPHDQFHTLVNLMQLICVADMTFHATGNAVPTRAQLDPVWKTLLAAAFSRGRTNLKERVQADNPPYKLVMVGESDTIEGPGLGSLWGAPSGHALLEILNTAFAEGKKAALVEAAKETKELVDG